MPPSRIASNPPASESSSASLVKRLKAGDAGAWQRLAQIYTPLVYRWSQQAGLRDSDAVDVVQEVFQAVAGGIDGFRRERAGDSLRGWLRGIARHKLQDHFRRLASSPEVTGGSENLARLQQLESLPEERDTVDRELCDLVQRAAALIQTDFQEKTWRAFWRTSIDRQPAADVAQELGLTVGAVHAARFRVLKRLREELV